MAIGKKPEIKKTILNGFTVDATVTEDHNYESEVTSYPIEKGADITDHVRARPVTVSMECIVTDTPIGIMRDIRSGTTLPSDDILKKLLQMRDAREPITIETSLRKYENMVLQSFSIPRSNTVGDALRFNASFIQIELVTNNRTTIKTAQPRGQNKRNLGAKALKDAAIQTFTPTLRAVRNLGSFFTG
jgi:hypothetical protein